MIRVAIVLLALAFALPAGAVDKILGIRVAGGGGAIAHDVTTVSKSTTTASTCNFSHAAGGSPTLVLLWVALDGNIDLTAIPTYAGNAMTEVCTGTCTDFTLNDTDPDANSTGSGDQHGWLYYYINPTGGSQTVDADFTSTDHHTCIATTFTGTDATTPIAQYTVYDNNGGTAATCVTTLTLADTANWMVTYTSYDGFNGAPAAYTNCTMRNEGDTGGGSSATDDSYMQCDSTGNSGSRTHTVDGAVTNECAQISVELQP